MGRGKLGYLAYLSHIVARATRLRLATVGSQILWIYYPLAFGIYLLHLFVLESSSIIGIGYILDYPWYIDIVFYLDYICYRS